MKTRLSRQISCMVALVVVTTACGESAVTSTTPTAATSIVAPTTSNQPRTTTSTSTPTSSDIQASIDWFVSILNGDELTEAEYESRFSDEFRRQVAFANGFRLVLDQFRPDGPYTVAERTGQGTEGEAIIVSAAGTKFRVLAELDDNSRFAALLIQPAEQPSLEDPPETVEEGFRRLADIGALRALAAEVVGGECVVVDESNADEPAPLGSVFKLYVLAALGDAVHNGDIAWYDEIEIKDELKSVPSGVLQDRKAGETVTVREAAELMISISDNTATDHLIDLLGRQTVESALAAYGNTSPDLNTPFLNTREFTALKVGPASGLSIQWLEGDEKTRRSILSQISDITPGDLPVQEWVDPIQPDLLEWFASPQDLCTLALRFDELTDSVPEIGDILSANPGTPAGAGLWDTVWFKGGSEPGLAAMWFVTRLDGRTFVTTGSVVDPDAIIDTDEAILLFSAVRDLLSP